MTPLAGFENAEDRVRWGTTWALRRAVMLLAFLLGGAVLAGSTELVVLALPLAIGTALAWITSQPSARRSSRPAATVLAPVVTDQGTTIPIRVELRGVDAAQAVAVRVPDAERGPHGRTVVVAAGAARDVAVSVPVPGWGTIVLARPDLQAYGPDGLFSFGPVVGPRARCRVLPTMAAIPVGPLPPRAISMVGSHHTRRPGEGSELIDVREFRPGDRLRRIDWRVSARRGTLHVRRTAVDADADIVLCLDTRMNLGVDVETWPDGDGDHEGPQRSLDQAVGAVVSLAGAYLWLGDRVGVVNLSDPRRGVAPGAGRRQLTRIRWQLADLVTDSQARRVLLRTGAVPSGAVVIVLSTFMDAPIVELVSSLYHRGGDVLAVDVLPGPLRRTGNAAARAAGLVMAERRQRLADLQRRGVLVTRWDPALVAVLLRRRQQGRRAS
ncbi:MAG: DUF58 domain-containing protein [Jiangellaceae bacterium]